MIAPQERSSVQGEGRPSSRSSRSLRKMKSFDQASSSNDCGEAVVKRTSDPSRQKKSSRSPKRRSSLLTKSSSKSGLRRMNTVASSSPAWECSQRPSSEGSEQPCSEQSERRSRSPKTIRRGGSLDDKKIAAKLAVSREKSSSESSLKQQRSSSRSSSKHLRRMSSTASSKPDSDSSQRPQRHSSLKAALEKSPSGPSTDVRPSMERTDHATVQEAFKTVEAGDDQAIPCQQSEEGGQDKNPAMPPSTRVPRSSRKMRRMLSMETPDKETDQQVSGGSSSKSMRGRRSSISNDGSVGACKSMHGRSYSLGDGKGKESTRQTGSLEGPDVKKRPKSVHSQNSSTNNSDTAGETSRSKSTHKRRSSTSNNGVQKDGTAETKDRSRSKSSHRRLSLVNNTDETKQSASEGKANRRSKSKHQRSSDRDSAPNGEKRSARSSKSRHQRSSDREGAPEGEKVSANSTKSSHRRSLVSQEKDGHTDNASTPKSSLKEALEKSKETPSIRRIQRSKTVGASSEGLRRPKSVHTRSISTPSAEQPPSKAKSMHRRSIGMGKPEESAAPAPRSTHRRSSMGKPDVSSCPAPKSTHRRFNTMGKPDVSSCPAPRSTHRRSIGMGKPEEPAPRSVHRRSIGGGKDPAKNERIPRSRRTSISEAKKSLLDMHLSNEPGRPRSRSPTNRNSGIRAKFVRSNSCDSRRSTLEEADDAPESQLLKPLPKIQRKPSGPIKLQRKGTIERRQTVALLGAQALAKPALELSKAQKKKWEDLGNKFKSSAMGISQIVEKNAEVNQRLGKLPSLGQNRHSSLTGAMTNAISVLATTPTAASIAFNPVRRQEASRAGADISSLANLKELLPMGAASHHKIRRSKSIEFGPDFSSSSGTISTASLSQSMLSGHTANTTSTGFLSMSAHSKSTSSEASNTSSRGDASAMQARSQRLRELSQTYRSSSQITDKAQTKEDSSERLKGEIPLLLAAGSPDGAATDQVTNKESNRTSSFRRLKGAIPLLA